MASLDTNISTFNLLATPTTVNAFAGASVALNIGHASAAASFAGGVTVASGKTLTLTGATVAGTPTWSSSQAITLSTAAQPNITSVGTLTSLTTGAISTSGTTLTGTGSTLSLFMDTADASDTKAMFLSGGGAAATGRGAFMQMYGNDHASYAGNLDLYAGSNATSLTLYRAAASQIVMGATGTTVTGTFGVTGVITTGANAADGGQIRLPNFTAIAARNAANSANVQLLYLSAADVVISDGPFSVGGYIKSTSASGGIGYATGAGGAVTQATSKSTEVTLNKVSGTITMHNAALAAGAVVYFKVTNSAVVQGDVVAVSDYLAGTTAYETWVSLVANGSFYIGVRNTTAGSRSEALTINFAVIKAVSS